MSREILVIRHGLSEANNRENVGTPAFGSTEAPLMKLGREQARQLGKTLLTQYEIDLSDENICVATSNIWRAKQTALDAGAKHLRVYDTLNEAWDDDWSSDEIDKIKENWRKNILPDVALSTAEKAMEYPPEENIWFTHGLVIAGLCQILNKKIEYERIIPKFCEIRKIEIDD